MIPVTIYMKRSQQDKLHRLGGAPWVRAMIEKATDLTSTVETVKAPKVKGE